MPARVDRVQARLLRSGHGLPLPRRAGVRAPAHPARRLRPVEPAAVRRSRARCTSTPMSRRSHPRPACRRASASSAARTSTPGSTTRPRTGRAGPCAPSTTAGWSACALRAWAMDGPSTCTSWTGARSCTGTSRASRPRLDAYVAAHQDSAGEYEQDLSPVEGAIRFARGEIVAWSGQSGAGPPHLHFEVRRGDTNYDPLLHGYAMPDHIAPTLAAAWITPHGAGARVGGGVAAGARRAARRCGGRDRAAGARGVRPRGRHVGSRRRQAEQARDLPARGARSTAGPRSRRSSTRSRGTRPSRSSAFTTTRPRSWRRHAAHARLAAQLPRARCPRGTRGVVARAGRAPHRDHGHGRGGEPRPARPCS